MFIEKAKNILITGGAGFIGSRLAHFLKNKYKDCNVVVFDCFRNGSTFENGNLKTFGHYNNLLDFSGTIIAGNINNKVDLDILNDFKFDLIFHFAAISDTRVYDQEFVIKTNLSTFHNILMKAKKDKATLVYASSGSVYGNSPAPQKIGDEKPQNPYAFSKFGMDQMAKQWIRSNKSMKIVGLRYFNVYGPGEFYKGKTSSQILQIAHKLLANKEPILFKGSSKIYRDFVYIKDVISATILAVSSKSSGIYNIGYGKASSFQDIADFLQDQLKTKIQINYIENPYLDYQSNTVADINNAKRYLNYKPKFDLKKGILDYLTDLRKTFEIIK